MVQYGSGDVAKRLPVPAGPETRVTPMHDRFWLMWGWLDPKGRPAPRLVVKREGTYSETSYNLLLDRHLERESGPANFELGRLVGALGGAVPKGPDRLLEEGRFAQLCASCRQVHSSPCHVFVRPWPGGWNREVPFPGGVRSLMQKQPGSCYIFAQLADLTETRWERRFYELYFRHAFDGARRSAFERLQTAMADLTAAGLPAGVSGEEWVRSLWRSLAATLTVPALLPQVVLNFVQTVDLPPDHPDLHFFEGNVGRVDFAFVHNGERHVVEIDSAIRQTTEKSHARTLRVHRTLRRQGWHVHRFSRLEVSEATDFEEFAWELGFPTRLYSALGDSSDVSTDDGLQAIDP